MFRIDQILTATTFIRHFQQVAKVLFENQEPLLLTQRNGRFLVVMDADFFQGLMDAHHRVHNTAHAYESSVGYDLKAEKPGG
jgi:hypothetical protein